MLPTPDVGAGASIAWLGHASAMIDIGGVKVLTDPALTRRVAHLRRRTPLDVRAVDRPDLVLISHLHMDHLHVPSLRLLGRDVPQLAPKGAGGFLRAKGFRAVREVESGTTIAVGSVTIDVVPAVHGDRRGPHVRRRAAPIGFVVRAGAIAVYFAGDTDLFPEMSSLQGVDVALLPIWGWGRSLGPGHLDPRSAVTATELVAPRLVVPIHWGTFSPLSLRAGAPGWLDRPVRAFGDGLEQAGLGDRLRVLEHGRPFLVPPARVPPAPPRE